MKTLMVMFGVNILPWLDYPPVEYPPVQNVQEDPALAERYFKERIGIGPYQCALPGEAYIGNACQRLSGGPDRFRDMFRRDRDDDDDDDDNGFDNGFDRRSNDNNTRGLNRSQ